MFQRFIDTFGAKQMWYFQHHERYIRTYVRYIFYTYYFTRNFHSIFFFSVEFK